MQLPLKLDHLHVKLLAIVDFAIQAQKTLPSRPQRDIWELYTGLRVSRWSILVINRLMSVVLASVQRLLDTDLVDHLSTLAPPMRLLERPQKLLELPRAKLAAALHHALHELVLVHVLELIIVLAEFVLIAFEHPSPIVGRCLEYLPLKCLLEVLLIASKYLLYQLLARLFVLL